MPEDWGRPCHHPQESQQYAVLAALDVRYPATFGAVGGSVQAHVCPQPHGGHHANGAVAAPGADGGRHVDGQARTCTASWRE